MDLSLGRVRLYHDRLLISQTKNTFISRLSASIRHQFEWKREECFLVRKPDPPVMVAIAKEPPGKIKTKAVQILDYNLGRSVNSIISYHVNFARIY